MGAIETMMLDCAYSEIGKFLGMPTQAYIALSDAKQLDSQAGLETGIGATLAALSGINNISGPGMLDFVTCQSLEKLVVDDEICGMTLRMLDGIEPREDFPALALFQELLREKHLIIADHTRRHLKEEIKFPGPVIDRANRSRWLDGGGLTLGERASKEVERLVQEADPSGLAEEAKQPMIERIAAAAKSHGMDKLPARDLWTPSGLPPIVTRRFALRAYHPATTCLSAWNAWQKGRLSCTRPSPIPAGYFPISRSATSSGSIMARGRMKSRIRSATSLPKPTTWLSSR
jgi:hypothetical protein